MEVIYEHLFASVLAILHLKYLVPLLLGTIAGVIGGALPGITITMTIIMVLPFTVGLDPLQGLAAMTGVYVGGSAGGSKPLDAHTRPYQCFAHTPSVGRGPGGQASIAASNSIPSAAQSACRVCRGRAARSAASTAAALRACFWRHGDSALAGMRAQMMTATKLRNRPVPSPTFSP